jgi:hypothetical protein
MESGSLISTAARPTGLSLLRYGNLDGRLLYALRKRYRVTPTQARVANVKSRFQVVELVAEFFAAAAP